MKLTITVVGLPIIRERWEAGAMAHEQHVAHAEPSELVVDAPDSETILEQAEAFLCNTVAGGNRRAMPTARALATEGEELARKVDDLQGSIDGRDHVIANRNATIEAMKPWKGRALSALEIVGELQSMLAGSGKSYPKGLRKRITELRADYPAGAKQG